MDANQLQELTLSNADKALLAREIAADGYEPSPVADIADVLRVSRESFIAGRDAAVDHMQPNGDNVDEDEAGIECVLGRPTRWRDFVETLKVERF